MRNLPVTVLSGVFALTLAVSAVALADSDAKKVAKACKDKEAGTMVVVHGKKMKCPEKRN